VRKEVRAGAGNADPSLDWRNLEASRLSNSAKQDQVIAAPFVRIEREVDGEGWVVIAANGHGWLHGARPLALRDKRWHDRQWDRP
jgi:hypothetical protein